MVQAPQCIDSTAPALSRLLARLTNIDVPESSQSLAARLSQWLGWTDAIALSAALNGAPPAVASGVRSFGSAEEHECARVRATLAKTIANDNAFATASPRGSAHRNPQAAPIDATLDYAAFRQRYLAMQQTMETAISELRGRLRRMLAARTPDMARLALVDATMERALGAHERNLLGAVPGLLAGHFERLRQAGQAAPDDAPASVNTPPVTSDFWLDVFRKDMQSVLLAELDVRFQPVEGLLAALHTR
ncbi:DUF3348 domain-containing protein [Paraburkholderia saeva]|uniref:DUF3348 domain-containing protein n=1 Tax=Paraburkholderia saeva TaxID=2777537 RepID=A0A9N8RUM5_9BURK|nr:DUF3348 domain-containing protein [Paraburkholderia saeva]CAG4887306.1 hypothetical protein R52603_00393 [Paraburkholderia saeva]CAG4894859.1 hypothetical protein LMG31841_02013 [Paraburkholderia saeva]CAG4898222.1 hypothetical protein R70241_02444 [Paraburkholderia saeva]